MKKSAILIFTLFTILVANSVQGGKVYRWVDDDGTVHFGDRIPKGKETEVVKNRVVGKSNAEAIEGLAEKQKQSQLQKVEEAKQAIAKTKVEAEKKILVEACGKSREQKARMDLFARIKLQGEDGEVRILSEEEKQAELKKVSDFLNNECIGI